VTLRIGISQRLPIIVPLRGVGLGVGLVVGSPLITSLDSEGARLRSGVL